MGLNRFLKWLDQAITKKRDFVKDIKINVLDLQVAKNCATEASLLEQSIC